MDLNAALLRDIAREPVGRVSRVLLDPDTLNAQWLQVSAGTGSSVLVPAATVSEYAPGELLAPYPAEVINAAVHPDGEALSERDAAHWRRHYGFPA